MERTVDRPFTVDETPNTLKRISWGAVIGGAVVTLVVQLMLGILGIGIGASTIDPLSEQNPTAGIGTGAGIWFVVSSVIALFLGGVVAGRLAGVPRKTDGTLHGILTFGVATMLTFYFVTTTLGSVMSGAAGVLGRGLSLAGQGAAAIAPTISTAAKDQLVQLGGINLDQIKNEAETLLRQTGKEELQPDEMRARANIAGNEVQNSAAQAGQNPMQAGRELNDLLQRIAQRAEPAFNAADRDALINIVQARSNMNREQAASTVARWEDLYKTARARYEEIKTQAVQQAKETADAVAEGVSRTALWTFAILLLGIGAAALGGRIGTPFSENYGNA